MKNLLKCIGAVLVIFPGFARASWLCEEAASVRDGQIYTVCGIGENAEEDLARKAALVSAFTELDLICNRSAECRDHELNVEPKRNDCHKNEKGYKCYRAIHAEILEKKRVSPVVVEKRREELEKKESLVTKYSCSYETKEALNRFSNLTSERNIDEAVKGAVVIPMRLACTRFHYSVMNHLEKAKIKNKVYNSFLLSSVQTNSDPDELNSSIEAIGFLHSQGPFDQKTWEVALGLFSRLPSSLMYRVTPQLFHGEVKDKLREIELARLDETMALANSKKIGRPTAISPEQVFLELARGVTESEESAWIAQALFRKYFNQFSFAEARDLISYLLKLYKFSPDPGSKIVVVRWLATSVSNAKKASIDDISQFPKFVMDAIRPLDIETSDGAAKIKELRVHKDLYIQVAAEAIDRHFALMTESHQVRQTREFCLEHNVSCPQIIPNVEGLKKMLQSQTVEKRKGALEILVKQTEKSRALENEIFQLLIDENAKDSGRSHEVVSTAIQSLVNHRVEDPKKIRRLMKLALDRAFSYDDIVKKLGPLATPAVVEIANDDSHPSQFTGIRILRTLMKLDPKARKALQTLTKRADNPGLARAAQEALDEG